MNYTIYKEREIAPYFILATIQPDNNAFGFTMFAKLPIQTTHQE